MLRFCLGWRNVASVAEHGSDGNTQYFHVRERTAESGLNEGTWACETGSGCFPRTYALQCKAKGAWAKPWVPSNLPGSYPSFGYPIIRHLTRAKARE